MSSHGIRRGGVLKSSGTARLLAAAVGARRRLLRRDCDRRLLASLYHAYNPVPHVGLFVSRALAAFPRLCCGLATVYLQRCLGEGRVIRGAYAGTPHTFLVAGDVIIDITADQFGGPEVYVGPCTRPWQMDPPGRTCDDASARAPLEGTCQALIPTRRPKARTPSPAGGGASG